MGKGKQWEEQEALVSTRAWAGERGSGEDGAGRGPGTRSHPSSCLPTRPTVKNWPHFGQYPTQALLSTHLSKQPLIKQKEQKVGGGAGSEGTGTWPGWLWWLSLS